ncbi:hypothetical protein [Legionella sp. CNM-4043-24]|uniref:hypothetical protein n=1 Tax=Legionella sp. CNM-4043-24 TaxID=3421646 RepID=UPI00403A922F
MDKYDRYHTLQHSPRGRRLYSEMSGNKKCQASSSQSEYEPDEPYDFIARRFALYEQTYGYLRNLDQSATLAAYRSVYLLFAEIEAMSQARFMTREQAPQAAYLFLVLFGGEACVEEALSACESYCETFNLKNDPSIVSNLAGIYEKLRLINNEKNPVDLPAWRAIIQEQGERVALPVFYLASEIETHLGHAPASFHEAESAAQALKFANATQYPDLADFCVKNLIPEALFDRCGGDDPDARVQALSKILHMLPSSELRAELVRLVPLDGMDLRAHISFLCKLNEEAQLVYINRFKMYSGSLITTQADFLSILSRCTYQQARIEWLSWLSESAVPFEINKIYELSPMLRYLDSASRMQWLSTLVKPENLRALLNSSYEFEEFLRNTLPEDISKTDYLIAVVGVEKINSLTTSYYNVKSQLRYIAPAEQLSYIKRVLYADTIKSLIDKNLYSLESVLEALREEDRFEFLVDVLDIDTLRAIVPVFGDMRPQRAILSRLHAEHHEAFIAHITPEAEKNGQIHIKELKQRIIDTDFNVGLWGGVNIQLDNGLTKAVPSTVAKQWTHIQNAESKWFSYADSWAKIQQLSSDALTHPKTMSFWSRSGVTNEYYGSFKSDQSPRP